MARGRTSEGLRYLMVVPVAARSLSPERFALEGPFAEHLKTLRAMLSDKVDELVVAGFEMTDDDYAQSADHLGELDVRRDRIRFVPLVQDHVARSKFWLRHFPRVAFRLSREVVRSGVIHAGPSHDLWVPIEFPALALGAALRRTTISITDIDNRESARMMAETGRWSRRTYLVTKYLYDPVRDLQHRAIARMCDLVLFKGDKLLEDYGAGRPHVRTYCDPGFEAEQVVEDGFVSEKFARIRNRERPLELIYFGRYVYYKGVHHLIAALAQAMPTRFRLNLMGAGEEEPQLRRQAAELGVSDSVVFHEPVRYGDEFFTKIRDYDLMLASPLGVDTPRSTWDAFAAALPVLAYDTEFYAGLARQTGAVDVVPWNDIGALAKQLRVYDSDRELLVTRTSNAVKTARDNTQRFWLEQRVQWTREALGNRR